MRVAAYVDMLTRITSVFSDMNGQRIERNFILQIT